MPVLRRYDCDKCDKTSTVGKGWVGEGAALGEPCLCPTCGADPLESAKAAHRARLDAARAAYEAEARAADDALAAAAVKV